MRYLLAIDLEQEIHYTLALPHNTTLEQYIINHMFEQGDWFGLEIDYLTDECYDPIKCLPGACAKCNKCDRAAFAKEVLGRLSCAPFWLFESKLPILESAIAPKV